ncbi:MAG: hypothetical protein R3C10_09645 [Pirellulales bacterium]
MTISDHIEISGDFTHTSGVVDASGSTVEFQGYNATISSGDVEFANVIFDNSGNTTIDGELTVSGDSDDRAAWATSTATTCWCTAT